MHQRIQSLADWRPANGLKIQVSRHLIIISNQQKAVCIAMNDKKKESDRERGSMLELIEIVETMRLLPLAYRTSLFVFECCCTGRDGRMEDLRESATSAVDIIYCSPSQSV